jgi:hypothetical protein
MAMIYNEIRDIVWVCENSILEDIKGFEDETV